jgi:hypothetical protein
MTNFVKIIIIKKKKPPLCTVSHVIFLGGCGAKIRPTFFFKKKH